MVIKPRNTGSAGHGLGEWLVQRLSAVYLAGFVLWLFVRVGLMPFTGYPAWKAWMAGGVVRFAFALFFLSLFLHAWVGLRSVFLDYLKPLWLRFFAQAVTATSLLACAFWVAQILLVDALR
jgi:succinate dehydrogenase / fumarate reductase membrane anchor subunit